MPFKKITLLASREPKMPVSYFSLVISAWSSAKTKGCHQGNLRGCSSVPRSRPNPMKGAPPSVINPQCSIIDQLSFNSYCTWLFFFQGILTFEALHKNVILTYGIALFFTSIAHQWWTVALFNPQPGMGFKITRPGRGGTNSAPMKAKITKFLCELVWLNISIVCNFGDPRSVSSR